MTAHESDEDLGISGPKAKMATDYDAPRKTDEELNEDSIEELKTRRNDKNLGRLTKTKPRRRKHSSYLARTCRTKS